MPRKELKKKIINLILRYPPEIALMAKEERHYDRIREKDFFRKMAFWTLPSIDTTYFALQTLVLLSHQERDSAIEDFLAKNATKIKRFIFSLYDEKTGGFFQTNKNKKPSLHATHCAIGLINCLHALSNGEQVDYSKPTTKKRISDYFCDAELGKDVDIIKEITRFVSSCFDQNTGGFYEIPKNLLDSNNVEHEPSINNTASALWCSFHLEGVITEFIAHEYKDSYVDIQEATINFIGRHIVKDNGATAYKNFMYDECPWICSTYYAERAIRNLNGKISPEDLEGIFSFIISIKKPNSGFCAGSSLDENIIHTKDSMSILRRYVDKFKEVDNYEGKEFNPKNFIKSMCKDVNKYLNNTSVNGGFATAERERYLPNVYTTRLAYDIINYLDFFSKEFNFKINIKQHINTKDTVLFLLSCFNENDGAFRGYSYDSLYIRKDYIKTIFGIAA